MDRVAVSSAFGRAEHDELSIFSRKMRCCPVSQAPVDDGFVLACRLVSPETFLDEIILAGLIEARVIFFGRGASEHFDSSDDIARMP